MIAQISLLGASRQALFQPALDRLLPHALFTDQGGVVIHSIGVAVVVLLAWTAAALGAGDGGPRQGRWSDSLPGWFSADEG